MNITLDYLSAFVDVYKAGSFAQAAIDAKCHATTFSRKVSALEDEIGFELFIRHGRSLEPTSQADSLFSHAKALLVETQLFERTVKNIFEEHSGESIILVDAAVQGLGFVSHFAQLIEEMPSLKLTLKTSDTQAIRRALISGEADMAFTLSSYVHPTELNCLIYKTFEFVRVASPQYLAKFDYQAGEQMRFITARSMLQVILAPLKSLGVENQIISHRTIDVDSTSLAKELVLQGSAWSNLPRELVASELATGALKVFEVEDDFDLHWSLQLLWSLDRVSDPVRERLIEILCKS